MLARVTTWEGGTAEGLRAASEQMRSNVESGPPEGMRTSGITMLVDPDGGRALMIGLFPDAEALEESEKVLATMTPPEGIGSRTDLVVYEVAAEARL
jgi:hypothetical protein